VIFDKLMALPANAEPWVVDHQPLIVAAQDEKISPAAVADATARAATVLGDSGVVPGKRCVVWLETPVDILVAYTAITAMGAVPILISPTLPAPVLATMVRGVRDITAVIAAGDRLAQLRDEFTDLAQVDWAEVAARLPGARRLSPPPAVSSSAAYVVVHTSGTTSVPKLVECSSESIEFNARVQAVIHWAVRLHGHLAMAISPVHGRTVVGILAALMRKAPLMLLQDDSPDSVERMIRRHRPEYLETHPNTFRAWQHLAPSGAFASVRLFGAGFDVVHPDTVRALLRGSRYRSAMFVEVYGQNESGPVAIRWHLRALSPLRRASRATRLLDGHAVGPRFPFCRVRILDDSGHRVSAGTPGRIVVKTPGTFSGYINCSGLTSRNYPRGRWWDTGDWGSLSRFGMLTLVDRQVDKVAFAPSAIAIENVLLERFPDFLELVILNGAERLQPVLSLRPGTQFQSEAWQQNASGVAPMADPLIIPDSEFPRTVTGKIKRNELIELVRERLSPVG
jgi:acyl-coenzyme A synthetase/AMP-(fatty) acid ligase